MYSPWKYQMECLDAVQAVRDQGLKRALIVMATGLGKTVTMAFDAKKFRETRIGPVLFLCHNNDILYQAKTTFQAINGPECSYGYFNGDEKHFNHVDFLFASFQTMEESRDLFDPSEFAYIMVDESHHAQADTFRSTIEYFTPEFLLGATATPDRLDQLDIRDIFGQEVYYLPLEEAMARGLVTPVDYRLLTDEIQISEILETEEGKVSLKELNRRIFIPRRDDEIARIIAMHASEFEDPRIIIFCTSIKHCDHLSRFIPDSFAIHSEVPDKERSVKLEMFRQGLISTVLAVDALNEGIDVPQANIIVFLRSTTSQIIFLQQLGRGLRKSDGKDKVIALDFVSNCERIKMVHELWKRIEDASLEHDKERTERDVRSSMTMNVNSVEFVETIMPLLSLMERVRPTRVSEVLELAREYSTRNTLPADMLVAGTGKKLWWKCSACDYEWQATGAHRMNGTGCPACAGRVVTKKNSLGDTHPELSREYMTKNELSANEVLAGTNKKLWWKCLTCTHEWEATGSNRLRGHGCPACSGRIATPTKNLALSFPLLVLSWSPRNIATPDQVLPYSNRKFWWVCQTCSHEWEATPGHRNGENNGCPACARRAVTASNCLAATHPELAREYSDRNQLPATAVFARSDTKYWWMCSEGHEWKARGDHRAKGNSNCPECKQRERLRKRERTVSRLSD